MSEHDEPVEVTPEVAGGRLESLDGADVDVVELEAYGAAVLRRCPTPSQGTAGGRLTT